MPEDASQVPPSEYTVGKLIGKGGFAEVYDGTRRNGQEVVLKFLHDDLKGKLYKDQFKREAKLQAELEHHYILPILDFVEDEKEAVIVTKKIDGDNLRELIKKGDITEEEKDRYLKQIASAADFINDKDILHRDFKPSNILITNSHSTDQRDRADRNVMVCDFGISNNDPENKMEEFLGSPLNISPEQVLNTDKPGDKEVFQTGLLVFELYMGKSIGNGEFNGNGNDLKTPAEKLSYILSLDGLPSVAYGKVAEKYGDGFADVLSGALKRKPSERFDTATEFVESLLMAKQAINPKAFTTESDDPTDTVDVDTNYNTNTDASSTSTSPGK